MQLDNLHSQNVEKDILATHLATVLENLEDDRIQLQSLRQDRDESRRLSTDVIDKYKAGKVKGSEDFMAAYLSIVVEQKFRHNAHNETMESDLWKNGFYDVAWAYFRTVLDSEKYEKSQNEVDFQLLIEKYGAVKGLFLRNEFVMTNVVVIYDSLMAKGEELTLEIHKYLDNK